MTLTEWHSVNDIQYWNLCKWINSRGRFIQEQNWRICDELEGNWQPFPLSSWQHTCRSLETMVKSQHVEQLSDLNLLLFRGDVATQFEFAGHCHCFQDGQIVSKVVVLEYVRRNTFEGTKISFASLLIIHVHAAFNSSHPWKKTSMSGNQSA